MELQALALSFVSPYHVGWRYCESIIESLTIHRALVNASTQVEASSDRIEELSRLRVSAAIPLLRSGGCFKLALPLPSLPSKTSLKKSELRWITLRAAAVIASLTSYGTPLITKINGSKIEVKVVGEARARVELCYKGEIIHSCDETLEDPLEKLIKRVERDLNRIDRVTNAADVYRVCAYEPTTKLAVLLQGARDSVEYATRLMKILSELGIGGLRSRGFGKFMLEQVNICDVELICEDPGSGPLILLGSHPLSNNIDQTRSFVNRKVLSGRSGPSYDEYKLPLLNYAGAGSIVYATRKITSVVRNVSGSSLGSIMIFNPVIACPERPRR